MTREHPSASPLDAIDEAVDAVEAKEDSETVKATFVLSGDRKVEIVVPHPFSADDMESVIVVLLQMRAASEARVAAAAPIVVPMRPAIVDPTGKAISSGRA